MTTIGFTFAKTRLDCIFVKRFLAFLIVVANKINNHLARSISYVFLTTLR